MNLLLFASHARQAVRLTSALDTTLRGPEALAVCGATALSLYRSLSPHTRHIHGLQCWFALRWSEIAELDLQQIVHSDMVDVRTTKGGKHRRLSCGLARRVGEWQGVEAIHVPPVVSYDMVASDVLRAIRRLDIPIPDRMKHHTHIWRHLRAEHMYLMGCPLSQISEYLGHRSADSTRRYLPERRTLPLTPRCGG